MKNYHIKVYETQLEQWASVAAKSDPSLSSWIRNALDSAAVGKVRPVFTEPRMVRGRSPDREQIAVSIQFRVTEWEVQEWTQSAQAEGLLIGEWCRQVLDHVAESAILRKVS